MLKSVVPGPRKQMPGKPGVGPTRLPDYSREETRAHQLDRNWSELIQELRVIGTGIQILFAFLLSIAFQARFSQTTGFERGVYLGTMLASGLAAALFIAPVALHRFVFQLRVKDELVAVTNRLAVGGLSALSVAMVGAVLLVSTWVGGLVFGCISSSGIAVILGCTWFVGPATLRHRARSECPPGEPQANDDAAARGRALDARTDRDGWKARPGGTGPLGRGRPYGSPP
jgi:hypothetical protein